MALADVAAVHPGAVVKKGGTVGFLCSLEQVEQVRERMALGFVAALGTIQVLAF
jgi:hypothetical protein